MNELPSSLVQQINDLVTLRSEQAAERGAKAARAAVIKGAIVAALVGGLVGGLTGFALSRRKRFR